MSHWWKKVQDGIIDEKAFTKKKKNIIFAPSQRYQDFRHLLQNPTVPSNVMGFSNCAQRITPLNYLS